MRENAAHRRNDPKFIFVDECQLGGIGGICAVAQPECVKDGVLARVSVDDCIETKITNGVEIQGRLPQFFLLGLFCKAPGQFDI